MQAIPEIDTPTGERFRNEVLAGGKPVVMRGLVRDWPIVAAGRSSPDEFCEYLRRFDRGYDLDTAYGAPSIGGRIFYNDDLSGLNCRMEQAPLSSALDYLLEHFDDDPAPTLAIQSVVISRFLPGMQSDNRLPQGLLPDGVDPRFWLGSRTIIAAHYDPSENVACCVAGSRRFTLLPPGQVANLYVGPFELTPAGAVISMVDFDRPDLGKYPKFEQALEAAWVSDLEPGDAIYIPYLWWHHVRGLDRINGLVNYWWAQPDEQHGDPRNALFHAMMSVRSLPPAQRRAWQAMFEFYVFDSSGHLGEHLPESKRGILGNLEPGKLKRLRMALSRALSRS